MFQYRYYLLGIIGSLVVLYGTTQWSPQLYYIFGAFALLSTAVHYRLVFFIALELILIAGHGAIILGSGPYTQIALPILLSVQLFAFYYIWSKENFFFVLLGVSGIALLSVGFSYQQQWIFFFGSLFIACYAYFLAYSGCKPAYIWAILNTLFVFLTLFKVFIL
ncbi:MAG: hypothetical protein BGO90_04095 [Legionella sp. 40-6]|nr:hypothetical protein [Legionella sp.]OJY07905.1 MAG: hypothetical protein BGO90_04095 [Legionella sp. 40-6]